jgi:hypothetical protein
MHDNRGRVRHADTRVYVTSHLQQTGLRKRELVKLDAACIHTVPKHTRQETQIH